MPELLTEMERELRKWRLGTKGYGGVYVGIRSSVIVFSALVAAQNNLMGTAVKAIVLWVPVMAVVVTILTAIDSWQKPQVKWRGFMKDRDDLEDLLIRTKDGREDPEELRKEFADLRRRHREENVY